MRDLRGLGGLRSGRHGGARGAVGSAYEGRFPWHGHYRPLVLFETALELARFVPSFLRGPSPLARCWRVMVGDTGLDRKLMCNIPRTCDGKRATDAIVRVRFPTWLRRSAEQAADDLRWVTFTCRQIGPTPAGRPEQCRGARARPVAPEPTVASRSYSRRATRTRARSPAGRTRLSL